MTREEAIEVYNGLINEKIKEAFEFFAPELAESDDERIRKYLYKCAIQTVSSTFEKEGLNKESVLAWLEKQKEQKPMTSKEIDACIYPSPQEWDCQIAYSEGYRKGMESIKPAEWSEEDEAMLNAIIKRYGFAVESDFAVFIKKEGLTQMEKELAWLKSLRPQPKVAIANGQVWKPSEEQMEAIYNILHPDDPYYDDLKSLYDDLKKL